MWTHHYDYIICSSIYQPRQSTVRFLLIILHSINNQERISLFIILWLYMVNCVCNYEATYCIVQNFDGYLHFKYLMQNILTDGYCLSPYTFNFCTVLNNLMD